MKKLLPLTIFFLLTFALHAQRKDTLTAIDPDSIVYEVRPTNGAPTGDTVNAKYIDVAPQFPGGEREYFHFLQANLHYPQKEKENGTQGNVYISFIVEKDGRITNLAPEKEVEGGPGLTREAIRVFRLMPRWKPGTAGGKPVRTKMVMPVGFRLG